MVVGFRGGLARANVCVQQERNQEGPNQDPRMRCTAFDWFYSGAHCMLTMTSARLEIGLIVNFFTLVQVSVAAVGNRRQAGWILAAGNLKDPCLQQIRGPARSRYPVCVIVSAHFALMQSQPGLSYTAGRDEGIGGLGYVFNVQVKAWPAASQSERP